MEYFNDQPIKDFEHFSKMLKNNQNKYAVFENNNGYQMVINHEEALASADQILSRYRIPAGHSENLFK